MSVSHTCRGTLWPLHTQRPVPSACLACPGRPPGWWGPGWRPRKTPRLVGAGVEAQEDPWQVGAGVGAQEDPQAGGGRGGGPGRPLGGGGRGGGLLPWWEIPYRPRVCTLKGPLT